MMTMTTWGMTTTMTTQKNSVSTRSPKTEAEEVKVAAGEGGAKEDAV